MLTSYQSFGSKASRFGFTLIELIIAMAVLAILVSIALPDLRGMVARNQLIGQANELAGALALTRSEAVTRGSQAGFCVSTDGSTCGWPEEGDEEYFFLVFLDTNSNFDRDDDAEPLKVLRGNPDVGFSLDGDGDTPPDTLYFNPSGFFTGNANASLEVCHRNGGALDVNERCRTLNIAPSGRVTVRPHGETT